MNKIHIKWIEGYVGRYAVTSDGRILSRRKTGDIWLSVSQTAHGYNQIHFDNKSWRVCRLVALAHIPNPEHKAEVNHIDEDKTNDNTTNLEWSTRLENIEHSRCKAVAFRSPTGQKVMIGNVKAFALEHNLNQGCLQKVKVGTRHTHKGFTRWTIPN